MITQLLTMIPKVARPFLPLILPQVKEITPEHLKVLDADFENLLDGLANKDQVVVADFIRRWHVSEDGLFGHIILRLMGVKEEA